MATAVVVDIGSYAIRSGASHNFLSGEQPSVVTSAQSSAQQLDAVGSPAVVQAVRQGQISDWDALERILYDALYTQMGWELGEEGYLLIAEPVGTSREDRERLTQLAFEVFNVTGLFFAEQAVLSLFAIGRSTGLVIDLGHDKTDVSMVVDGALYLPSVRRLPIGGRHVTQHLQKLLTARGTPVVDAATAQGLKEAGTKLPDGETSAEAQSQEYRLPDNSVVAISASERLQLAECLLQPSLMGFSCPSVVDTAASSVFSHLDPAVRKAALDAVLICGGGSSVPGLQQKLCRDLRQVMQPSSQPCLCSSPEYMPANTFRDAAWMGGAVLSKILLQHNHYISKGEYEEFGPGIAHRKMGL